MAINATKQPWNVQPRNDIVAPKALAHATFSLSPSNPSAFWYEHITHDGTSPFIPNGANWNVFRNVVSGYGADPSGNADSRSAIQNAINGMNVGPLTSSFTDINNINRWVPSIV